MSEPGGVQAQAEDTVGKQIERWERIVRLYQGERVLVSAGDGTHHLRAGRTTTTDERRLASALTEAIEAARVSDTLREALREIAGGRGRVEAVDFHTGVAVVVEDCPLEADDARAIARRALAGSSVPGGEGDG